MAKVLTGNLTAKILLNLGLCEDGCKTTTLETEPMSKSQEWLIEILELEAV
jgi:hypothetical protein